MLKDPRFRNDPSRTPDQSLRSRWLVDILARPYPRGFPSVVLVSLILVLVALLPAYFLISELTSGRTLNVPEVALDRAVPLQPAWTLVYVSIYAFVYLPLLVVRQDELFRRAALAYLMVVLVAYLGFLVYPTVAPRPTKVIGEGFLFWCLRLSYSIDPPYNCFPSLHVAHSFVSAMTGYRVHRGVGFAAVLWASLIGVSTLFTKQHYIADVIAGMFIACVAYLVFLRGYPREAIPEIDRRLAPVLALGVIGIFGLMVACVWVAYQTS